MVSGAPCRPTIRRPVRCHRARSACGRSVPDSRSRRRSGSGSSTPSRSSALARRTVTRWSRRWRPSSAPRSRGPAGAVTTVAPHDQASHVSRTARSEPARGSWWTRSSGPDLEEPGRAAEEGGRRLVPDGRGAQAAVGPAGAVGGVDHDVGGLVGHRAALGRRSGAARPPSRPGRGRGRDRWRRRRTRRAATPRRSWSARGRPRPPRARPRAPRRGAGRRAGPRRQRSARPRAGRRGRPRDDRAGAPPGRPRRSGAVAGSAPAARRRSRARRRTSGRRRSPRRCGRPPVAAELVAGPLEQPVDPLVGGCGRRAAAGAQPGTGTTSRPGPPAPRRRRARGAPWRRRALRRRPSRPPRSSRDSLRRRAPDPGIVTYRSRRRPPSSLE